MDYVSSYCYWWLWNYVLPSFIPCVVKIAPLSLITCICSTELGICSTELDKMLRWACQNYDYLYMLHWAWTMNICSTELDKMLRWACQNMLRWAWWFSPLSLNLRSSDLFTIAPLSLITRSAELDNMFVCSCCLNPLVWYKMTRGNPKKQKENYAELELVLLNS